VSERDAVQVINDERLDSLELWRDDVEKRWAKAFPGGDHEGHRRYHEVMIEELHEKRQLRKAIMEKTVAGLVWAILVGVALACWNYLKAAVK